jgi:hypothetical protein
MFMGGQIGIFSLDLLLIFHRLILQACKLRVHQFIPFDSEEISYIPVSIPREGKAAILRWPWFPSIGLLCHTERSAQCAPDAAIPEEFGDSKIC